MRWSVAPLVVVACGGSSPPGSGPTAGAAPRLSTIAPAAAAEDLLVARVDGRPVWASCLQGQIAQGARTREAALEQCVAFELLAQAAERAGHADSPDVDAAVREAMVDELVASFEDTHAKPTDLGEIMTTALAKNDWRRHRPELRGSTYVRVAVAAGSGPEVELRARRVIDRVAAALDGERGLLGPHVVEVARRIAAAEGVEIVTQDLKPSDGSRYETPYKDALFAIAEVGRVGRPVRTSLGWDLIAWTSVVEAREQTVEELAAEAFPDLRRQMFTIWVNRIIRDRKVSITVADDQLREDGSP